MPDERSLPPINNLVGLFHELAIVTAISRLLHVSHEQLQRWLEHPDEMPAYEMRRIQACFEMGLVPLSNGVAVH